MFRIVRYVFNLLYAQLQVGLIAQQKVNERFGECLLELTGNDAITVMDDSNISLAIEVVLLDATGTTGESPTTCHRLVLKNILYLTEIFYGDRLFLNLNFLFVCSEASS